MLDKAIAITLFRRPEWTQKLLNSLDKCYGIEEYSIYIHQDWHEKYDAECKQSSAVAYAWWLKRMNDIRNHQNGEFFDAQYENFGVDRAKLNILPRAFEDNNYVIFMEDDTGIAQDALRWFEYAGRTYENNQQVASISGYSRAHLGYNVPWLLNSVQAAVGFCPWGWAMWRDRYERLYGMDGARYLAGVGEEANGRFDWWASEKKLLYIHPVVGRTTHATWENAEHTPSEEFWRENEYCEVGAWNYGLSANKESWGNIGI